MNPQTSVTAKTSDLPVTLAEAKEHLRILHDDLDNEVQAALDAAVEWCESTTGRALRVSHTLTQKYRSWPCSPVQFDRQPVSAISGVTYYDAAGDAQTLATSNYRLQSSTKAAGYLEFDDSFSAPSLDERDDAVTITYTAGYASLAAVPTEAKYAIRLKLAELFGNLDPRMIDANRRACDDLLGSIQWGAYR